MTEHDVSLTVDGTEEALRTVSQTLARMGQVSLIGYAAGGAFLNLAAAKRGG